MEKVIHDCDPGHDDAVAIMLAANNPTIDLLGVTVVAGNQTLEKTANNACRVLQWIGRTEIPVYPGCPTPIVRPKRQAGDIHGETGLDGPVFPPQTKFPEKKHAVAFMIDTLLAAEEPVTMVTTGPMTNLAMAIRLEPRILPKIKQIVLMGGSIANGNVTPAAEFNILCDPEAASICFTCGRPVVMMGLDVTRKVLCYPSVVERMRKLGTPSAELFAQLMLHFCKTQKEVFGWEGGPLHDPVTMAWLIDPSILTLQEVHVSIDIGQGESAGRTNCDLFDYLHREHNARVAVDIDPDRFWDVIEDNLRRG